MDIIDSSCQAKSKYFFAPRNGLYNFTFSMCVSNKILNATIKATIDKNGEYFSDIKTKALYNYYGPDKNIIRGHINVHLLSNETVITRINIDDGKTEVVPCEFEDNPEFYGMTIMFTE